MLTLFGSNGSGSAAVELALQRCDLPYRLERASTWEADSAQAALRGANPLGQIPTLVLDDGSALTESAAILIHLGLVHPASGLLPEDASARAQAIRGLVFLGANCYAAIGIIDYPERWLPVDADTAARQQLCAGARIRLHACWDVFADQFSGAPYLGGAQPGALDFLAAVVSRWAGTRAHLQQSRPALFATLERVQAHPAVAPLIARHWPQRPPAA